jgi:KipI family sensor histidine kinase inhibitor
VIDVVPAARTVLVMHDGSLDTSLLSPAAGPLTSPAESPTITLDVTYDGDDLPHVAALCGLSVHEVIDAHSAAWYTVAFCGFMPGFSYLLGLPPALHLPRLSTPRSRVPAGSVAIAAEFTGVYPRESPGGWHLLGRTDAPLWDDDREPAALLPPGTTVRFRPR